MTALRLLLLALLALLAAAAASPARAHETTRSYLALDREGARVAARLSLAFQDVEVVAWMDADLDGRITWGEAEARLPEATAYAAARLSLEAGGPCSLAPAGAGASTSGGVAYLDLGFVATCPAGAAPLRVASTLFSEIDPGHRLFLTVRSGDEAAGAILVSGAASVELAPAASRWAAFASYFRAGVEHLLSGADHIVFLLVLVLPAAASHGPARGRLLGVVAAVTGFTLAHALTLTAATTDLLRPPAELIEILIALSILVTAADNVRPFVPGPRTALAAFFGTIHGFGFATALAGLPLGGGSFAVALLGFNLGIEAAQVAVVLILLPALAALGGRWLVVAGSAAAAIVAVLWLWQRLGTLI